MTNVVETRQKVVPLDVAKSVHGCKFAGFETYSRVDMEKVLLHHRGRASTVETSQES